jgi:hypothetical protein
VATTFSAEFEKSTYGKVAWHLIPFLFLCYIVAFLDRVNVGFAKLQMAPDLKFSDTVYGFGAGIFFIGYFIFEVPSNVILERVGARVWIARIMITWGIISSAFMFTNDIHWGVIATTFNCTDAEFSFYFLRFLLGVAEAGFFPRHHSLPDLLVSRRAPRQDGGAVHDGDRHLQRDRFTGIGRHHAIRGRAQWLAGLAMAVPAGGHTVDSGRPDGVRVSAQWPQDCQMADVPGTEFVLQRIREEDVSKTELGKRAHFLDAFKDYRVWALAIVYFCGVVCFYAVNFWMPTIIQELGISKTDFLLVGLISMIPWGLAAVAMVVWGAHSDRTGERRWHAAGGLLVGIVGLLGLALVGHSPVPSIIALSLVTVGIPVVGGDVLVPADRVPVRDRCRCGHRLDQFCRQSRWTLRTGPDRTHPHGNRRRERGRVLYAGGCGIARSHHHSGAASNATQDRHTAAELGHTATEKPASAGFFVDGMPGIIVQWLSPHQSSSGNAATTSTQTKADALGRTRFESSNTTILFPHRRENGFGPSSPNDALRGVKLLHSRHPDI